MCPICNRVHQCSKCHDTGIVGNRGTHPDYPDWIYCECPEGDRMYKQIIRAAVDDGLLVGRATLGIEVAV